MPFIIDMVLFVFVISCKGILLKIFEGCCCCSFVAEVADVVVAVVDEDEDEVLIFNAASSSNSSALLALYGGEDSFGTWMVAILVLLANNVVEEIHSFKRASFKVIDDVGEEI